MKLATLLLLLLLQGVFIVYGLALTFWVLNAWLAGETLNALFGGFMGGLFFLMTWKLLRRWAVAYFRIGKGVS
jgi:hypothetical protein